LFILNQSLALSITKTEIELKIKHKGMTMKRIIFVWIIFSFTAICCGQQYEFGEFNTSRYARVIGLGNAFTGLADDIETVYYNSAGLATLDHYIASYSNGQGFTFVTNDATINDFAFVLPTFKEYGIFALSLDRLYYDDIDYSQNLYRLHFARPIFDNFYAGVSLNYYHSFYGSYTSVTSPDDIIEEEITGNSIDLSLSVLYFMPIISFSDIKNEARIGIQMQNVFDTDIHYNKFDWSFAKGQTLRIGFSNSLTPGFETMFDLVPFKMIIVADAVFYGGEYKFNLWQPNYGLELALFEMIKLRYGRENEFEINNVYSYSPQYPVNRFGIGLVLPIWRLFDTQNKLQISFDYSYSDWDKIDESKSFSFINPKDLPIRDAFSLKVSFQH